MPRRSSSKPTIKDVAKLAGVSLGTASRVVNNNVTVKPSIREKVTEAIKHLGYTPNAVAQSMRVGSTNTVGCILRDMTIPLLTDFVRAAHDTLQAEGFSLLISNTEGNESRERTLLANLARRRIDGVIIGPYSPIQGEFRDFLTNLGMPVVLLDRNEASWLDAVMIDHRNGMFHVVRKLLELGHRRIALITGEPRLYPARERLAGFNEAFAEFGVLPDPDLISTASFLAESAFDFVTEMFKGVQPPTAIIAGGMDMLAGVLRAVHTLGLVIPDDVSIVGAGDSELAELHAPPITMIDWDYANVGRIAVNLVVDRIRKKNTVEARHIIVPTRLVERASVAKPPAGQ